MRPTTPIFSSSLSLSRTRCTRLPYGPRDVRTRAPRPKEWSLKTHYRTLCRSFTFPSLRARRSCPVTATHRVSANQADRFETDRSYRPFNYFAISDLRSCGRGFFVPEDRVSQSNLIACPVRSPVSAVNYFSVSSLNLPVYVIGIKFVAVT